jgi:hypothetical protein
MLERLHKGVEAIERDMVAVPAGGRVDLDDHMALESVLVKDLHNLAEEDIGPEVGSLVDN